MHKFFVRVQYALRDWLVLSALYIDSGLLVYKEDI